MSTSMPAAQAATGRTALRGAPRFSVLSRLNRLSRLSGHIALVVSTILASAEAWRHVYRGPDTAATNKGSALELVYDPVLKSVDYHFRILLRNDGLQDDVLEQLSAAVESGDGGPALLLGDVIVTEEGDARLPLPIPVGSRGLNLSTRSDFNPQIRKALSGVGERQLVVRLRTAANEHTLWFCFDLPDPLAARLFEAGTLRTQRFMLAGCQRAPKVSRT